MLRILFFVFLLTWFSKKVNAQECNTYTPFNAVALEAANNHSINYQQFKGISECLNKTLSLNYIIVMDPFYDTHIDSSYFFSQTVALINQNVQILNNAFSPICLSFQVCSIDTVREHKYYIWNSMEEEAEFQVLFCKENVINIILIGNRAVPGGPPYASSIGISTPTLPSKDFIVLPKGDLNNLSVVHQMGHLFGLYHPFETIHGLELVNGSNCSITGDLVCDTPADISPAPWLGPPPYFCEWNGVPADINGDLYAPLFGNMMVRGTPCPLTSFTVGQYNRMIYYYKQYRGYLR